MNRQVERADPRTAIAMGRRYRRQTQQQLADALTESTGERWSRVMIGKLESGGKVLEVETLMAIATIQNLPYSFYLESPGNYAKGV
ncbi:MAG: hypothetical protein H0T94_10410 [Acidimicrobiia bacterium]|nr:hypothetical protein [Acidimicrobiia bacterium]